MQDDLEKAERRWRSRSIFHQEPVHRGRWWRVLLWLAAVGLVVFLYFSGELDRLLSLFGVAP